MQQITAKVATKLKKRPIASSLLSLSEFVDAAAGRTYSIESIESDVDGHSRVVLAFGCGTWFIFSPHWEAKGGRLISMQQATAIFGRSPSSAQLNDLNNCINRFEINKFRRVTNFTAQIGHESAGLYYTKETDQGWYIPERFGVPAIAGSDGGYKYRGAGFIQLSMPNNYEAFSKFMGDPKIFDLGCPYVAEVYPATSAGWWWMKNNMNALCDRGASVEEISRMVNLGGAAGTINGLADRLNYYAKASAVLGA